MHVKETNIKNRAYRYNFGNLESKSILINEENYKALIIYFTRYISVSP